VPPSFLASSPPLHRDSPTLLGVSVKRSSRKKIASFFSSPPSRSPAAPSFQRQRVTTPLLIFSRYRKVSKQHRAPPPPVFFLARETHDARSIPPSLPSPRFSPPCALDNPFPSLLLLEMKFSKRSPFVAPSPFLDQQRDAPTPPPLSPAKDTGSPARRMNSSPSSRLAPSSFALSAPCFVTAIERRQPRKT